MKTASSLRYLRFAIGCLCLVPECSLALTSTPMTSSSKILPSVSRKGFLQHATATAFALVVPSVLSTQPVRALDDKLSLTDAQLRDIVKSDVVDRQFLVTGDLTSSIYKDTATFTDEIDTYKMDQWMKGTQKLFVGEKSDVRLVGDVQVTPEQIEFRFDEDLCFRIPFRPIVSLSGKVVLTRDDTGYVTSYREFWDQDVVSVLKTAKFN